MGPSTWEPFCAFCRVLFCALGLISLTAGQVQAGASPENALVIIDPADPEALYLGNSYIHARQIPTCNVLYLEQEADHYADLVNHQLEGLLGTLANRGTLDQIDHIVLITPRVYRVEAEGLVSDPECLGVSHFSLPAVYVLGRQANAVLAGDADEGFGFTTQSPNGYFSEQLPAVGFDGAIRWQDGQPSNSPHAPRYFLATLLGYTGPRGNTPGELVAMIERSVAADGLNPAGTFYYMKTTDTARSEPRDPFFADAIAALASLGGQAVQLEAVLPEGRHDCLAVMTGWANPQVANADLTLLAGSFADHLTSWAATFDKTAQTKVSAWIAKGASGSHGTVEEPCADGGKFPHPMMHAFYFDGLPLAEAAFRSLRSIPFQSLIYGDPMTQPFAQRPTVAVPDAPTGVATGIVRLMPEASLPHPDAEPARFEFFVDGRLEDSSPTARPFVLETARLADGFHDVSVVLTDDSPQALQGRWSGRLQSDNSGRGVSLTVTPEQGDLSTIFTCEVEASGGDVLEIRLLQNGRPLAAVTGDTGTLLIPGHVLGGGPVQLQAEAEFEDENLARSPMTLVEVEFGGACCLPDGSCRYGTEETCTDRFGGMFAGPGTGCNAEPCFACGTGDFDGDAVVDLRDYGSFTRCFAGAGHLPPDEPPGMQDACLCAFDADEDVDVDLVDLDPLLARLRGPRELLDNRAPVAFDYTLRLDGHHPTLIYLPAWDYDGDTLEYTTTIMPVQAIVSGTGSTRVLRPGPSATGCELLGFRVEDGRGGEDDALILLRYPEEPQSSFAVQVSAIGELEVPVSHTPADSDGRTWRTTPFVADFANDSSTLTLFAPMTRGFSPFQHWVVNGERAASTSGEVSVPLDQDIIAVAAYLPCHQLQVRTNRTTGFITVFPNDKDGQGGGMAPFDRVYVDGTELVVLIAPNSAGGGQFRHWRVNSVTQASGERVLVVPLLEADLLAAAIYADLPGDSDDDGDFGLDDWSALQRCFSGDVNEPGYIPPAPECASAFDVANPPDGDVDLDDVAALLPSVTGPF